jgi:hypothetical protein
MHSHQVPHDQCCTSGYVYGCTGGCVEESGVGDDWCDAVLECYCAEESDCGKPP